MSAQFYSSIPLVFRCWDRIRQEMFKVFQISNGLPDILTSYQPGHRDMRLVSPEKAQHMQVMLCTPYKDIKDVPIFELDIIEIPSVADSDDVYETEKGIVIFQDGGFWFRKLDGSGAEPLHHAVGARCIVVGLAKDMLGNDPHAPH